MPEVNIHLRRPHAKQQAFIDSPAKRKVIRAGRRGGKTTGIAIYAIRQFLAGKRVLYAAPTSEQIARFWWELTTALREPIDLGHFRKNETEHIIEVPKTENRLRAKTAWNANTLRGDFADVLILDEWQLMDEDAWGLVGAPMLLDNDGDAVFIYTPPSLHSRAVSKASDPRHAAKLFKRAAADKTGRWAAFYFTSHDNPHISTTALSEITSDMTSLAYQQEILAEDKDEAPGALWHHDLIEQYRVAVAPECSRLVIGVDPPGGATEAGIIVAGQDGEHGYVLADYSVQASPEKWAAEIIRAYKTWSADRIVAEKNYGGDMVEATIRAAEGGRNVSFYTVTATRGKAIRAEPIAALYERGLVHHVGNFPKLEEEMCMWEPGDKESPNRMDACFVAGTRVTTELSDVPIERVTTADRVWTRAGWQRVLNCGITQPRSYVRTVEFSNGSRLTGTSNHRVFSPCLRDNQEWRLLGDLTRADRVSSVDGRHLWVVSNVEDAQPQPVYNLEVDGQHEYFANGILVHNCVWALTELCGDVEVDVW